MNTIFGPVPSRRLGRSLGIDVIPPKTCSYDCVYCESGPTTHLTLKRQAFVDPDQVIRDLADYFRDHPQGADVLTFSSAGEPTLYEPIGALITAIKNSYPFLPLVVLTNGSLLWDPKVRRDLVRADRVVPSIDAAGEDAFQKINRPHPSLDLKTIIEGLYAFRREYRGQLHLEVVLASGFNDSPEEMVRIRRVVDRLLPDQVELNTVVRPPAYPGVEGLSGEQMRRVIGFFPLQITRIIGEFLGTSDGSKDPDLDSRILELVRRRPCSIAEMASSLGVEVGQLEAAVGTLLSQERLQRSQFSGKEYFCPDERKGMEPAVAGGA